FEKFKHSIHTLQDLHEKEQVIVGFEPTGHYWMNLAAYLIKHDIPYVFVNPMHVSRTKELDDNLQTKNDQKDARVIAQLIRDGRFSFPRILTGVEAELRNASMLRTKIVEDITALKNRMVRWLDRFFPEFHQVFPSFGKNACAILEKTPLPQDVVGNDLEDLMTLYIQVEGLKCPSRPKIRQIQFLAEQSIGIREGLEMARFEIATLLNQYKLLQQQLENLDSHMKELAIQLIDYEYVQSVDGIGDHSITMLLSEIGSFTHYKHPRQLIKLAGLTLRENSS
ncbi:IS110 family transposase, partial [Aquibacillus sediminis]|uniref:IS110 family transposase n=1 Tax=Aquibacillus sediminis TaxID=2574734 RepID=UPI0011087C73